MNIRLILIVVMALALACNKDSSSPSNSSSLPASYTRYSSLNQRSAKENFYYDANQNIANISFLVLDTTGEEVAIDSGNYSFILRYIE